MHPITVAYVSTFPPRECGIATFTRDLAAAVTAYNPRAQALVIAINDDATTYNYGPQVRWQIAQQEAESYREVGELISRSTVDVVNVQHEFGIFGGPWGSYVLRLVDGLRKPIVTTLHTVLPDPDPEPKRLTAELCARSDAVVVMTPAAVEILYRDYGLERRRVHVILHGVPTAHLQAAQEAKAWLGLQGRDIVSTFGLINPGKGIEDVIDALPRVVARFPRVLYMVLGQTHPTVRRAQGEEYREQLIARVHRLGLDEHVRFNNRYLPDPELVQYLMASDIYVTAYHNPKQVVSGTLSYALGCGRAVVSTPYLYARDALADGRGVLVPFRDPPAIAAAVNELLGDPQRRRELQLRAFVYGKQMRWPRVASIYLELFRQMVANREVIAS